MSRCSAWGRARPARDHDPCEPACLTPNGEPKTRLGELSLSPRLRPLSFDLERTLRVFLPRCGCLVTCGRTYFEVRTCDLLSPSHAPGTPTLCVLCAWRVAWAPPATSACCTSERHKAPRYFYYKIKSRGEKSCIHGVSVRVAVGARRRPSASLSLISLSGLTRAERLSRISSSGCVSVI